LKSYLTKKENAYAILGVLAELKNMMKDGEEMNHHLLVQKGKKCWVRNSNRLILDNSTVLFF